MPYPHVTQFETLERRARLAAAAPAPRIPPARAWRRLRLRRRLTPQPC